MTLQDDDYNCGVYVVYILSNLITDSPIENSINGDELRQYYQILFNERHINDFDTLTSMFFSYADRFMITESEEGQLKRYVGEYENQKRRYTKKEWDDVLKKRRIAEEKKKGNDNTSTEEQNEEDELNQALLASLNDQETQNKLLEIPEFHETMDKIPDRVNVLMFLEDNNRLIGPNDPNKQRVEEEINKTEEDLNLLQQRVQSMKPLQAAMDDLNLKNNAATKIQNIFRTKKYRAFRKKAINKLIKKLIFQNLKRKIIEAKVEEQKLKEEEKKTMKIRVIES